MGNVPIGAADDTQEFLGASRFQGLATFFAGWKNNSTRGSLCALKSTEVLSAALSGGTSNIGTNPITAGMFVLGVVISVVTTITGCTTFKVGDGTDDDHWGATIALTAGTVTTSANFTAGPALFTGNTQIVLTAVGGGASFSAGVVRAAIHYIDISAIIG